MEDNLSEILRPKREDEPQGVNLSCGNCEAIRPFSGQPPKCDACGWVYKPAKPRSDAQHPRAKYEKQTTKDSIMTIILVVVIWALVANWSEVKHLLGLDTTTVQQVEKTKDSLHLYLEDGTVWQADMEGSWQSFLVLAGDKIRFEYSPRPETSAGSFDGESCWLHDTTRPQTPIIATRVAGNPNRDSCPAQ